MILSKQLVASFYVRSGDKFTFDHIPDGNYQILYCSGYGWESARRDFSRGRRAVCFDSLLDYKTQFKTEGTSTTSYTDVITLTLGKTTNGNASSTDIPLEEFDRY
jgi:hypothetical protein